MTRFDSPAIHLDMLIPLLVMAVGFMFYFAAVLLVRVRGDILQQEGNSSWVREMLINQVQHHERT